VVTTTKIIIIKITMDNAVDMVMAEVEIIRTMVGDESQPADQQTSTIRRLGTDGGQRNKIIQIMVVHGGALEKMIGTYDIARGSMVLKVELGWLVTTLVATRMTVNFTTNSRINSMCNNNVK